MKELHAVLALVAVCVCLSGLAATIVFYALWLQERLLSRLHELRSERDALLKRIAGLTAQLKRKKDPYQGGGWK
jgi:hypothetical protein